MKHSNVKNDLVVRANDSRIPLEGDTPSSKKGFILRGATKTQEEIEKIEREGRREIRQYKKKCAKERSLPGLSKQDKEDMKKVELSTIAGMKKDNMRRQAEVYATYTGQKLDDDLSYNDLKTISIRAFLPQYTRGEELASAITHIVGGALGIIMMIVGIYYAAVTNKPFFGVPEAGISFNHPIAITCMFIFALGAIFLYTMSTIYHFLWINPGKKVLRIIDHCTIYFLIAASYTPISLMGLPGAYGSNDWSYVVLGVEWGLGIFLTVLNCLWLKSYWVVGISMAGYIILGWMIAIFAPQIIATAGLTGFTVILFGGIAYTFGAIFHGMGHKIKYMHAVAHSFYVIGTLLHFIGILLYYVIGIAS